MHWLHIFYLILLLQFIHNVSTFKRDVPIIDSATTKQPTTEIPRPLSPMEFEELDTAYIRPRKLNLRVWKTAKSRKPSMIDIALQIAAKEGIDAMTNLYQNIEPEIVRKGQLLEDNHPAALLSKFSAPAEGSEHSAMAAYATITATKAFRRNFKESTVLGRQAQSQKVSFRRTPLEGLCPPREAPTCMPASQRYRTHDGTCNNRRRPRWGSAQMPFNRFLPPEYGDGVDSIRGSVEGGPLSSARFVSLLVHGAREGDAPLTIMIAQWGQLLDHDLTSTAQPRSINGSVPSCCGSKDFHPSCFPIKVPLDDPWLAPLKVRCLEFLRSAPAQRRDCVLSWREQTNQVTSFLDASPIYSSNAKTSDNARIFRNGLLVYGRGNPADDVCMRGAIAHQCIRSGDGRSGEQPGLLALHHVWVGEHNRIATELSGINPHWSDEKVYQETRRIIGALFQHITYREFLPIVLGREVVKLFDVELLNSGYYTGYDPNTNPSVSNSFAAAAFRFGHSLVQNSYMRCDRHHNFINNNVTLHEEFQQGDIGTAGSLHRLIRGLAAQRALKRDEFITPELTNHLFQTPGFPFGLDLAAINIQRGRDHGIAPYTAWRQPCGLTPITSWDDLAKVVGPESAKRISHAYRNVHDIDLFVGGIAERPVVGGLVGPTFACIIAQQFSNSRKGDRFWYENPGFESSFTPAQLHSLRHVSLSSILCRAVGGGTFQPHVFIPSDIAGNDRVECGQDPLAPIDLGPWLEQDPFLISNAKDDDPISHIAELPAPMPVQVIKEEKGISNRVHNITMVSHVDFIPNGSIGFHRVPNMTKIHDKLDMAQKILARPSQKPFAGISNKLDKGRLPSKKQPKPTASLLVKRPSTTTRRTVVIQNVEIELRSSPQKTNKNKKKKTDRDGQRDSIATAAQNTIMKVAGVVRSQMNAAAIDALEPRTEEESDDFILETFTQTPTKITDQTSQNLTTKQPSNSTDIVTPLRDIKAETITEKENTTQKTIQNSTQQFIQNSPHDSGRTEHALTTLQTTVRPSITANSTPSNQTYEDFQALVDSALKNPTDEHKRVHRSPNLYNFNVRGVELSTHLNFADKLRTLQLNNKGDIFSGRHLTSNPFDFQFEPKFDDLEKFNIEQNTTKLSNKTYTLTNVKHTTTDSTSRNVEQRQYHDRPIYSRPQKLLLDGPNSDQYEIEINIRQTNPKLSTTNANYVDYNGPNKRYDTGQYANEHENPYERLQTLSTPTSGYYSHTTRLPYGTRTKPPTIIYINEHDDRATTTTRAPGFFQNIISFATNGFNNNKQQAEPTASTFHQTPNRIMSSATGNDGGGSPTSNNYLGSPVSHSFSHSKPSSSSYINSPQSKPTSSNYVNAHQVQSYPSPQVFPHQGPSSFNPVGGGPLGLPPPQAFPPPVLPGANSFSSASNAGGLSHATSSAVSTGQFGAIVGSATSTGGDSTFSFNIRPSSRPQPNLVSPTGIRPNYEHLPPRRSQYSSTPSYAIPPKPISTAESFHYPPNRQDPFSGFSRPPPRPYHIERPTNVYDPAYDDLGRSELKTNENGNIQDKTNTTKDYEDSDSDEYDYSDDDDDDTPGNTRDTDNDVDEEGPASKFDKDGYLRPEHMAAILYKETIANKTNVNITELDDNFVLPVLRQNDKFVETNVTLNSTNAMNTTTFPPVQEKSFNNNILAEDYDEHLTARTSFLPAQAVTHGEKRKRPAINLQVAFAPIKILTKPERPDNWVIFDTPKEKPILPIQPDYNSETLAAAEFPMPFDGPRIQFSISATTTQKPLTTERTTTDLDGTTTDVTKTVDETIDETTTLITLTDEQTTTAPETTNDDTTQILNLMTDQAGQETEFLTTTERTNNFDTTTLDRGYTAVTETVTEMIPITNLTPILTEQTAIRPTDTQTELWTEESTNNILTDVQTEVNLT